MLYFFFWVIPRRLNFVCRRFGTICSIFICKWVNNYTSLRKGDNHLQHNSFDLPSHGPPLHEPYLFHIPALGRYVGRYPFTTCCATGPTPTPSPSLLRVLAQAIFEPNLLPLATQTILKFSHSSPTSL